MTSPKDNSNMDRYLKRRKKLELPSITVTVRPISVMQFFRVVGLLEKARDNLGLSQSDIENLRLSKETVVDLSQRIFKSILGNIDYSNPAATNELADLVFGELGTLVGVSGEELGNADLDDLAEIVAEYWEVNSSGPLGEKIRAITERWKPNLELVKSVIETNFQAALIRALPRGGITVGGMTGSSPLSTENLDGEKLKSLASSLEDSSTSPQASLTKTSMSQPDTETSIRQDEERPIEIKSLMEDSLGQGDQQENKQTS